ncbi:ATP-binding protein [Candidatus Dependentiae bacterium]|nr:ATP-binding protein [Candidatus Dependentiae bacterium]
MIHRELLSTLKEIALQLPVIALLGPRQSGKTTLSKIAFDKHVYISLEDLDVRAQVMEDPRSFLERYRNPHGIILDEIQNVPSILSYIQTYVDSEKVYGYFILTGSQNFLVNQAVTQTLAGRIAILTLLPLSISELQENSLLPLTVEELVYRGAYPRLYDENIKPFVWYPSYTLTYIERDVRQVAHVQDLTIFQLFLKLCAGRIGQLLNLSSLANDCGIPLRTAQHWISLLQSSYIVFLLQPHYKNFNKRLVKTPKLYFYDTGLACSLLGIDSPDQVYTHYLKGSLVECLIISELQKQYYNRARLPNLYFWRDSHGHEVDCIIEKGIQLIPVEIKAGKTVSSDYFTALQYWYRLSEAEQPNGFVVYGGLENQKRNYATVLSWKSANTIISNLYE